MSGLFDATTQILSQSLDGLVARQAAISSNLTNIDTPGYQPQTVDFETALSQEVAALYDKPGDQTAPSSGPSANVALFTTDPRQFSSGTAVPNEAATTTESTTNESLRNDGNTVDLETEMTGLTETQIKFEAVSRLMSGKLAQLQTVLGGG